MVFEAFGHCLGGDYGGVWHVMVGYEIHDGMGIHRSQRDVTFPLRTDTVLYTFLVTQMLKAMYRHSKISMSM